MHELLLSYKNNNVLLDGIKKQSKEEKFTCPNCREEYVGPFPVCRLTEYLKDESIQKEHKVTGKYSSPGLLQESIGLTNICGEKSISGRKG